MSCNNQFVVLLCTWEKHGRDHFWLFQRVNNAALEGLTDGRLQVADRKKGWKGWDCQFAPSKAATRLSEFVSSSVCWSNFTWAPKFSKDILGFLPHPGETVLPKFIHDEAWSVWQVLDWHARNERRQRERGREREKRGQRGYPMSGKIEAI